MFKLLNNIEIFSSVNLSPSQYTTQAHCECPYNNCKCPVIDNNKYRLVRRILGFIILIASVSLAIYRIKTHADNNKGNYESEEYILGVILISFCCNMCYLPYALLYSFVFKKF